MDKNKQTLINENSHLFWWVPEDKKKNLSLDSLVEAILNYEMLRVCENFLKRWVL